MTTIARMLSRMKRIPNYVSEFGAVDGIRLFAAIEFPAGSNQVTAVDVPGFKSGIRLRETIADRSAFWICIVARQYSIEAFPQKTRLNETYRRMLQSGRRPLIIDAGANVGMSALALLRDYPEAQIVAVEPDADNYGLLVENTRAYSDQVTTLHGGVWPRPCALAIENPQDGAQHFRTREEKVETPGALRAYTMAEILAQAGESEILYAKIDIEGGQQALFEENTDWVACTHLIALELDDWRFPWEGTSRSFFRCVCRYPFDYLLNGENIFCFQDLDGNRDGSHARGDPGTNLA